MTDTKPAQTLTLDHLVIAEDRARGNRYAEELRRTDSAAFGTVGVVSSATSTAAAMIGTLGLVKATKIHRIGPAGRYSLDIEHAIEAALADPGPVATPTPQGPDDITTTGGHCPGNEAGHEIIGSTPLCWHCEADLGEPSSMSPDASESELQAAVIGLARENGWRVAHFRPARIRGENGQDQWRTPVAADGKGFFDLTLAKRGYSPIFAELKSRRGTVSPDQTKWIEACAPFAVVWRPADWPEIVARLTA